MLSQLDLLRHHLLRWACEPPPCTHHGDLSTNGPLVARPRTTSNTSRATASASSATSPSTPSPSLLGVTLVCISDTHDTTPSLPDGDILVHAGDLSESGTLSAIQVQLDWLASQPHAHKVLIGGNHDSALDAAFIKARAEARAMRGRDPNPSDDVEAKEQLDFHGMAYLNGESVEVQVNGKTVKLWGSPLSPSFGRWAFQYTRSRGGAIWAGTMPSDADVVLVHGPARGYLDYGAVEGGIGGLFGVGIGAAEAAAGRRAGAGCAALLDEVRRARPRVLVTGHIHEGRGAAPILHGVVARGADALVDAAPFQRGGKGREPGWGFVLGVVVLAAVGRVWTWALVVLGSSGRKGCGCILNVNAAAVDQRGKPVASPAITVVI